MDRQNVLERLSREAPELRCRFGVKDLAVFGSVARDQAGPSSDLDVLISFEGVPDFDRFMDVKLHLEDLFDVPVDLVTPAALRPEIRPHVEREAIHVS